MVIRLVSMANATTSASASSGSALFSRCGGERGWQSFSPMGVAGNARVGVAPGVTACTRAPTAGAAGL
jgi:hypothetical protein